MNAYGVNPLGEIDKSIQPVSLVKRILGSIIDLVCVGIFSLGIYSVANIVIEENIALESKTVLQEKMIEHLINSQLFYLVDSGEDNNPETISDNKYNAIISRYTDEQFIELEDRQVIDYYNNLETSFSNVYSIRENYTHTTPEEYINLKKQYDGLFNSSTYDLVTSVEDIVLNNQSDMLDRLDKFYNEAWNNAFELIQYDTNYRDCVDKISRIESIDKINLYSSITIAMLVFCLIIPLCSKYYQTIGKKITKIVVIDSLSEELPLKNKIILRFLILLIGEVILSFELLAIPLLSSLTFMCFSKKRFALHDYPLKTKVVLLEDYKANVEFKVNNNNVAE